MTIDIARSIKHKRILYKWGWESILDAVLDGGFWLLFPVFTIVEIFIQGINDVPLLVWIVDLYILSGLYLRGKLICIEGGALPENREAVVESLKSWYPNIKIIDEGKNIIEVHTSTGMFTGGHKLVILFDENSAYVNKVKLMRHDIRSPFHAPFHYISLFRLKKEMTTATSSS
ncbi:hypothetical protein [Flavobacterium suzhouense]|uniref:Uncharacterized protein n=1 Tax=Flavobacterium suzhouense TaxID=1529638 RepID=A0ABW5NP53_9FLAO